MKQVISLIIALILNQKLKGRTFLRSIYFLPAILSLVTVGLIWNELFYRVTPLIGESTGLEIFSSSWLGDPKLAMYAILIVNLWQGCATPIVLLIAGLQSVPQELYEAGALDGIKTRWHELWYITLPSMKSILLFGAVMQIQTTFSIGSVITALAGYPSVDNSVDTLVSHLTDIATVRYEMGYAAALSVFLFLIMAVTRVCIGKILNFLGK